MYNLVHVFVGVLLQLGVITEDGAKELGKEFSTKILPSNPEDAMHQVEDIVKSVERKIGGSLKAEPWLDKVEELESRLKALESKKSK